MDNSWTCENCGELVAFPVSGTPRLSVRTGNGEPLVFVVTVDDVEMHHCVVADEQ
jgi:hypothetical protein